MRLGAMARSNTSVALFVVAVSEVDVALCQHLLRWHELVDHSILLLNVQVLVQVLARAVHLLHLTSM